MYTGNLESHSGKKYVIKGSKPNINPGQKVTISFQGENGTDISNPKNVVLTGNDFYYSFDASSSEEPVISEEPAEERNVLFDFDILNDWCSGFNAEFTITNNSDTIIENWKLAFDWDKEITSLYTSNLDSHVNNSYVISGKEWNNKIKPGETLKLGFQGASSSEINQPENIIVTGDDFYYSFNELLEVEPVVSVEPEESVEPVVSVEPEESVEPVVSVGPEESVEPESYVYSCDFSGLKEGNYNEKEVKEALHVKFCNGADEGRVFISNVEEHGEVLDVKYPKGGVKTAESGMHTKVPFINGKEYDELYMSYWIYFPENFDFRAGGKLPGLAYQTDHRNMSLRLMWRYDGLIEYYVHYNTKPERKDFRASINWSLTDTWDEPNGKPQADQVKFKTGAWNHVELYYKLNSPGVSDGIMRGWLDGKLAIDITDQGDYRMVGEDDIMLNTIYLSTFFGGTDTTFQPQKDQYAYFDDIVVSTTRIGHPDK